MKFSKGPKNLKDTRPLKGTAPGAPNSLARATGLAWLRAIFAQGMPEKMATLSIICLGIVPVLTAFVLFGSPGIKEYTQLEVYQGILNFSGQKAYELLETLVTEYPNRQVGTENARDSAEWIAGQFRELGLETYIEEFRSFGVRSAVVQGAMQGNLEVIDSTFSPGHLLQKYNGVNVVGVSPGRSDQRVIIGAHRDIFGTIQGAEDNGSGTVTMLELARALSSKEHYYTYVFVSFDGEEVGLLGSANFASRQGARKMTGQAAQATGKGNIVLAMSLDMTGFKEATSVGFYQYSSGRGSAPLWTFALGKSVIDAERLPASFFGQQISDSTEERSNIDNRQKGSFNANPAMIFLKTVFERISGQWNTDSGPFIERSIPAIGIRVVSINPQEPTFAEAPIHTPDDTIDQVSAETLEMAGRFTERYIESLSLNNIGSRPSLVNSRYFTHLGSAHLSPLALCGFMLIASMAIIMVPAVSLAGLGTDRRPALCSLFRAETNRLIAVTSISFLAAAVWQSYRIESLHTVAFWVPGLIWLLLIAGGTLALLIIRRRIMRRMAKAGACNTHLGPSSFDPDNGDQQAEQQERDHVKPAGAEWTGRCLQSRLQQAMVDVLLGLIFTLEAVLLNPFIALASIAIPMFVINRLNAARRGRKWLRVSAVIIWTVLHALLQISMLVPYVFSPGSIGLFATMFLGQALWMYMVVYAN